MRQSILCKFVYQMLQLVHFSCTQEQATTRLPVHRNKASATCSVLQKVAVARMNDT